MSDQQSVGLLAGWGDFPLAVADALRRDGFRVVGQGIRDHADPRLAERCDAFRMVGIAKLGSQIRFFKRHGVTRATMAGKIFKAAMLFQRGGWIRHLPDWRCLRTFYPHFISRSRDRSDDSLLTTLVDAYAQDAITFQPATDLAPELLVKQGLLTHGKLTQAQRQDIEFGWRLAKQLGRVDVGQTVAVKGQAALAVEAIEGTDACIRRAGALCPQGGFTVVKVAKPQQDMRFDVPTIGLGTVQTLYESGGRVLAVEADRTILVNQTQVLAFARRHQLVIAAMDGAMMAPRPQVA